MLFALQITLSFLRSGSFGVDDSRGHGNRAGDVFSFASQPKAHQWPSLTNIKYLFLGKLQSINALDT
jgi:hypothetical protein